MGCHLPAIKAVAFLHGWLRCLQAASLCPMCNMPHVHMVFQAVFLLPGQPFKHRQGTLVSLQGMFGYRGYTLYPRGQRHNTSNLNPHKKHFLFFYLFNFYSRFLVYFQMLQQRSFACGVAAVFAHPTGSPTINNTMPLYRKSNDDKLGCLVCISKKKK